MELELAVNVGFATRVDCGCSARVWLIDLAWFSRVEVYIGAPLSVIRDIHAVSRLNRSLVHRDKANFQRLSTRMKTIVHIQCR